MKLFELSTQYRHVVDMLEAAQTGETDAIDPELLKDTLDAIGEAMEQKADNIARIMSELKATEEAIGAETKRLTERSAMIAKQRESLKSYLFAAMESAGKDKIKTAFYSYTIRNNPASVQIADASILPDEYIRVKTETAPDKKAIAEALKNGADIPGCSLIQSKSLVIK